MKQLFFLVPALLTVVCLSGQESFAVAEIPPALLPQANAVVRVHELRFEVSDIGSAIETEHRAITLLNERAASLLDLSLGYDAIQKITDIDANVYDGAGQLVRRIKNKDISDEKAFEFLFVNDTRAKTIHFPRLSYPFTIEYTVTTRHKGLMFYPVFAPQISPALSVQRADFQIIMPPDMHCRVREEHIRPDQQTGQLHWTLRNLPAYRPEACAPAHLHPLPVVYSAPERFSIEGYEGDMRDWKQYGQFIHQLNSGRQEIPAATVAELRRRCADCRDTLCIVERVYAYLQDHTRYFYVGLGIGGWLPTPAELVDKNKFGDCKGLSNYTVAMLQALGIPARYVLIKAGDENRHDQMPDFPNAYFNHAIACVPMARDTLWLECTSQTQSCGFMGDFTDDRSALMITPEGGYLVHTPKYDEQVNFEHRNADITLLDDGSARLKAHVLYSGLAQDIPADLAENPEEQRRKYLYEHLQIKDFEIRQLKFERHKNRLPTVEADMDLHLPKFAAQSGPRLFLTPVLFPFSASIPPAGDGPRQHAVQAYSHGFAEKDEFRIGLPGGWHLENHQSEPLQYNSPFGSYRLEYRQEDRTLIVQRNMVWNNRIHGPETYPELIRFYKNIAKSDRIKMVLVKKD
jgi:transglutaminase-like putative cysteine protease